jgi:hypothetical protein
MTLHVSSIDGSFPTCNVRFETPETQAQRLEAATREGWVPVRLPAPGPALRGRLGLYIEAAIEDALERRGSTAPGVGASADLDASLSDQLYRARLIGARGLILAFDSLEGIASGSGALDADDSAVLRWWMDASRERPVELWLDERDRRLGIYAAAVPLEVMLASRVRPSRAPLASPEIAASVATMELSPPPPAVVEQDEVADAVPASRAEEASERARSSRRGRAEPKRKPVTRPELTDAGDEERPDSATARAMAALFADAEQDLDHATRRAPLQASLPFEVKPLRFPTPPPPEAPTRAEHTLPLNLQAVTAPPQAAAPSDEPAPDEPAPDEPAPDERVAELAGLAAPDALTESALPPLVGDAEPTDTSAVACAPIAAAQPEGLPEEATAGRELTEHLVQPLNAGAPEDWRKWMRELENARGPKPLSVIERMFVQAYVPLQDACALGFSDPTARSVLEAWSTSFARSYTDAFEALRHRGKRPTMVLDVPEIAQRLARLHGARTVELVLVDGLRFDVGQRMHEHLRVALGQRAALTERLLLWSALPSTTAAQLELIARGPDGLRDAARDPESTLPVARGRASHLLRRVRAGNRELLKLDVVEARLADAVVTPALLEDAARDAAAAIAGHVEKIQERTLCVVFGDHGFRIDASGQAAQGSATPEEVLVPAFAWLLGDVH